MLYWSNEYIPIGEITVTDKSDINQLLSVYIEEPYVRIYRPKSKFNFAYSMYNAYLNGYLYGRQMTLDDIRILAAKGEALRYSDLPNLRQSLLSSTMGGYNPTLYIVEGGYRLLVNFNDTLNPESGISSIQC